MTGMEELPPVDLTASLAVLARRPAGRVLLPYADGSMPLEAAEAVAAATTPEVADVIPASDELGTPAFTAEMAQAILAGQPIPDSAAQGAMVAEGSDAPYTPEVSTAEQANTQQFVSPDASPQEFSTTAAEDFAAPPEPAVDSGLLAGFDPAKYLGGGSSLPAAAPPLVHPQEAKTPENTGEIAPGGVAPSAYADIEPGGGVAGPKDSREAMQMLRELSVLKGN